MKKSPKQPDRRSLVEVAAAEMKRCRTDPNIVCVGFGLKFVKGRPLIEAALQYYVYEKFASEKEIRKAKSEPIPADVEGYQTDVLVWVPDVPAACPGGEAPTGDRGSRQEDPLVGGTSTTVLGDFHSIPTGYGTLGGICMDSGTGEAMALSNAHVYGFDTGNDAIQPWMPSTEYGGATTKYLFCGGPLAHLFHWTAPSPLTIILTAAAAGAWIAAAASDAEDPSRWGQRTGPVPDPGVTTERERVHLKAEIPHLPFPGRHWKTKTHWDYARITSVGTNNSAIDAERENEHVLEGKRVFTDRDIYSPGDRVTICAQLFSRADDTPIERFVVAHCVPFHDPNRVVRRVLVPSEKKCVKLDPGNQQNIRRTCVTGFMPQVTGVRQMSFRIKADPFILFSKAGSTDLYYSTDSNNPTGLHAIRIPKSATLVIVCPPSTYAQLQVFHFNRKIRARAFGANGARVDEAETTDDKNVAHTIELKGPEIIRIELKGGEGEGFLAAICVDNRPIRSDEKKIHSRYYSGDLDLHVSEPPGKWGVVVLSQTLDDTPTDGDPISAARRLSGIVDSANIVEEGECACSILYDSTFTVA